MQPPPGATATSACRFLKAKINEAWDDPCSSGLVDECFIGSRRRSRKQSDLKLIVPKLGRILRDDERLGAFSTDPSLGL
jgi:hypothetical protein